MMRLDISLRGPNPGDVLKFGFGRDVPPRNLKVDPYNTNFSRKSDPFMYQLVQFVAKFWAKSPDFSKFFLNLSQFWLKFGELLKNQPIHIPNFAFYKGSFIYQEADFATHVRHIPVGSFVLSTPRVTTGCFVPIDHSVLLHWILTSLS